MTQRNVLFEHIPKCGGTSVLNYLMAQYDTASICYIRGHQLQADLEYFLQLPAAKREQARLIVGHGAHHFIPHISPDWLNLTVLRNPVDRIISHYNYVLQSPEHYLHEPVTSQQMSLEDYATSGISNELRNNYICRFLGVSPEEAEQQPVHAVNGAYHILCSTYDIVGILERIDKVMHELKETAGFKKGFGGLKLNTSVYNTPPSLISANTKRVIAEVNALDVQLYERFSTQIHESVRTGANNLITTR